MATASQTFTADGTWVVPAGVSQVTVELHGATGKTAGDTASGGVGGRVQGTLQVTSGETLTVKVGGAADIRQGGAGLSDRVVVAGGGGGRGKERLLFGTSYYDVIRQGGAGGGTVGAAGVSSDSAAVGGGGTQSAGGAGGGGYQPGEDGDDGTFGFGGAAGGPFQWAYPGPGGDGWWGGGGGGGDDGSGSYNSIHVHGSGGGGSSYVGGLATVDANIRGGSTVAGGKVVFTWQDNVAPNAPNLTYPTGGIQVNLVSAVRMSWQFSDPNPGDSQSRFALEFREQGTTGYHTHVAGVERSNGYFDLWAGTLTVGDWEWRVRTYDQQGAQGPWTGWEPFAAVEPPNGPAITDPIDGQTIPVETYRVSWSSSVQDAWQMRRVADSSGTPATGTVYWDSGTVVVPGQRWFDVAFPTNSRFEHVQLRVRDSGLWSPWSSVRVQVSYLAPATPDLTLLEDVPVGAVTVQIDNPTPTGGQPSVTANDVWRRLAGELGEGVRVAAGVGTDLGWPDWTVASGQAYEYRVRASGSNSTSAWSGWDGGGIPGGTSSVDAGDATSDNIDVIYAGDATT